MAERKVTTTDGSVIRVRTRDSAATLRRKASRPTIGRTTDGRAVIVIAMDSAITRDSLFTRKVQTTDGGVARVAALNAAPARKGRVVPKNRTPR